jgi:hypothetical protein
MTGRLANFKYAQSNPSLWSEIHDDIVLPSIKFFVEEKSWEEHVTPFTASCISKTRALSLSLKKYHLFAITTSVL